MTNAKVILLALLIVVGMIVSPICAAPQIVTTGYFPNAIAEYESEGITNFIYSVNSSRAISNVQIRAPKGTVLNYTITYGAGNVIPGYITYLPGSIDLYGFGEGITTINIGSATDSRSFVDTGLLRKWEIVGYAREEDNSTVLSTGYAIYDVSLGVGNIGLQSGFIAYQPVGNLQPIESISFSSNQPVWVFVGTAERDEIQSGISRTGSDEVNGWLQFALYVASSVYNFVTGIFWLIKFLFIDNLLLIIALWISVSMAYSAISTRDVFQFYRKFFKLQKGLLDFITSLWDILVRTINSMVQIFVKWL